MFVHTQSRNRHCLFFFIGHLLPQLLKDGLMFELSAHQLAGFLWEYTSLCAPCPRLELQKCMAMPEFFFYLGEGV